MDQVDITRSQLRELAKKNEDITIVGVNTDARMIQVERQKYRGNAGEAKWMTPDGKYRKEGT